MKGITMCSICDHTMQHVSGGAFWCPRCGTITFDGQRAVPMLVRRCQQFEDATHQTWVRLGIAESIRLPAQRHKEQGE